MVGPPIVRHIEPSPTAGRLFVQRGIEGPVVMLNLLRFRSVAAQLRSSPSQATMPISPASATAEPRSRTPASSP